MHFLGKSFVKNARYDPKTLLTAHIGQIFKIAKTQKSQVTVSKMAVFDLQGTKAVIFQHSYLKFRTHMHLTWFFHISSVFLEIRIFPYFWKYYFNWLLKMDIWDSSSIAFEAFIFNVLLKTNRLYLLSCLRDNVSHKPSFLPKARKTWRHLCRVFKAS